MVRVEMHEATVHLSQLIDRALNGEQIVLTRDGLPAVRLVPERRGGGFTALAGVWQGRVRIADDFDELPDDLAESLGARP